MVGLVYWVQATSPEEPRGSVGLELVENALLTRVVSGPLFALYQPKMWLRGAVYDAQGRLKTASQKLGGLAGNQLVAADPIHSRLPANAETLPGTWLYGGHWMQHFGHFLIESLSTLWPEQLDVDGLVFHRYLARNPTVEAWQQRLVNLTGYGDLPIRIVGTKTIRVERLLLPNRSVVANGWAQPEAVALWRRMARRLDVPFRGDRVFLSRSRFNKGLGSSRKQARTTPARDRELDQAFCDAGYQVVCPERVSVEDQIALTAGASVVAGPAGSGLHLSVFAGPDARVIEVGDCRSPSTVTPMQQALNVACGHLQLKIPATATASQISATLHALDAQEASR